MLVVKQGTNRNDNMIIHPNALPCPMEWPTRQYYKANGVYIPMPNEWATQNSNANTNAIPVNHDYTQVTPTKKFKTSPSK